MGGGICHHQRGEIARVFVCLCAQIGKIDIPIFQAGYRDNFETSHGCAGRVRAVGRSRYEANIAMGFVARSMIRADRQ
jgi:hypothetical protein